MRNRVHIWLACVALLIGAEVTTAAENTAAIHGVVTASIDKLPLPGVQVTLSSTALPQPRLATTDDRGRFFLIALPRAEMYTITISLPGFHTTTAEVGGLGAGESIEIEGQLPLPGLSSCGTCWAVHRFSPTQSFMLPMPRLPHCGVCL